MLSALDYDQIEPRLLAYFLDSIEETRLVEYCRTTDPYSAVVGPFLGIAPEKLTYEQRQKGKILFLSLMYGGGVRTVRKQFGVTHDQAKAMIRQFYDAWPEIDALRERIAHRHARKGYIITPWGRQLHAEQWGEHKLLNKLIQGSAADIMKRGLRRVHEGLKEHGPDSFWQYDAHVILIIHDEIVVDHASDALEFIHDNVPVWMTDEPKINAVIPLTAGHEVARTNWADMHSYEEALEWVRTQST